LKGKRQLRNMKETKSIHNLRNGIATGMIALGAATGMATLFDNFGINSSQRLAQRADGIVPHAASKEGIAAAENQIAAIDRAVQKTLSQGTFLIDLSINEDKKTIQKSAEILVFEREERPAQVTSKINQLTDGRKVRTKYLGLSFLGLVFGGMLLKIDRIIKSFKEVEVKDKAASSLPRESH